MSKAQIVLYFLIISTYVTYSQDLKYKSIKFDEIPSLHKLVDNKLDSESVVIIQDKRYIQVNTEGNDNYTYRTIYEIVKINDDAGIELINKVRIPFYEKEELLDLQVRTIDNLGNVKDFDKENLKELENVDGYHDYKIFAVEGLVKGGELEFTFTTKTKTYYSGREIFQKDVFIEEAVFELIYPTEFSFSTKSYNDFPERDTIKNGLRITAKNIPAFPKESYSSYKSKLMRVDYKVEINPNKANVMSWSKITRGWFHKLYTDEGQSQAQKYVKGLNLDGKSDFDKIVLLEKNIKENFTIKKGDNKDYSDVKLVFKNHIGNVKGILKAYIKCLEYLKPNFCIVLTCSRFSGSIDPDYEHSMDLKNTLFYFPETQKYLSPFSENMRLGPAPEYIAGNTAIFIATTYNAYKNDQLSYVDFWIGKINYLKSNENHIIQNAEIVFNENIDDVLIKQKNIYQGYYAYNGRYKYTTGDEKQKQEFINTRIVSGIDDAVFKSFVVENGEIDLSSDSSKYLICNSEYSSKSLVEKAGKDIVIALGKVIGKQKGIYEEKDRISDVILPQTKFYQHKLTVNIPEGYVCKGLEKLKINNVVSKNDTVIMQFVSNYELINNQLIINITESYNVLELDKSYYNDYRKVVNSAADFNKIVLVLESLN